MDSRSCSRRLFRGGLLITAVVLGAVSAACAHLGPWQSIGKPPRDIVTLPVLGSDQVDSRCGPNAMAEILHAYGDAISEPDIAKAIQNDRVDASLSIDLLLFARSRGFQADFDAGTLDSLLDTVQSGRPAVLLLNLEPGAPWPMKGKPMWHYVVAYGFSRSARQLLVHSGVGPRALPFDKLESMWKPAGHWMMYFDRALPLARAVPREKRNVPALF